jgi:hypothetical protein
MQIVADFGPPGHPPEIQHTFGHHLRQLCDVSAEFDVLPLIGRQLSILSSIARG